MTHNDFGVASEEKMELLCPLRVLWKGRTEQNRRCWGRQQCSEQIPNAFLLEKKKKKMKVSNNDWHFTEDFVAPHPHGCVISMFG